VTGIEQSVQALALPQQPDVDPGTEYRRDPGEHMDRDPIRLPALDAPDRGPRDVRLRAKLGLGPLTLAPERPHPETEADDLHAASMTATTSSLITSSRAARYHAQTDWSVG
jgi:hypothetical protein